MKKAHTYIALALLLAACTVDNQEPTADAPVPVAFTANIQSADAATRAKGEINEADLNQNGKYDDELSHYGGFGVFGCYTGLHKYVDSNVHPDFMYNEHVTWDANQWTYSPPKYWPNGEGEVDGNTGREKHYVSFLAYAPYSDNNGGTPDTNPAGYCIPSFSMQGEVGNPWLTYRLIPQEHLDKQVDLLCATPVLDMPKPAYTENKKVHFTFNHALACVGDEVNLICSEGLRNQVDHRIVSVITDSKVEVTSLTIEYTLTAKARLVLWNQGEINWETIWSEAPVCTRTVTLIDPDHKRDLYTYKTGPGESATPQLKIEDYGVFYIPAELTGYAQTAKVNITYRIGSYNGSSWIYDSDIEGTATLTLHDYKDNVDESKNAYKPGKHLYINVTLNQMSIALTAAIAPWVEADPVEMEGIED